MEWREWGRGVGESVGGWREGNGGRNSGALKETEEEMVVAGVEGRRSSGRVRTLEVEGCGMRMGVRRVRIGNEWEAGSGGDGSVREWGNEPEEGAEGKGWEEGVGKKGVKARTGRSGENGVERNVTPDSKKITRHTYSQSPSSHPRPTAS